MFLLSLNVSVEFSKSFFVYTVGVYLSAAHVYQHISLLQHFRCRLVGKQMTQVVSLQTCSWKVAVLRSLLWGFFGQVALLERLVHVVLRYNRK